MSLRLILTNNEKIEYNVRKKKVLGVGLWIIVKTLIHT